MKGFSKQWTEVEANSVAILRLEVENKTQLSMKQYTMIAHGTETSPVSWGYGALLLRKTRDKARVGIWAEKYLVFFLPQIVPHTRQIYIWKDLTQLLGLVRSP